jgi:hypothetical protein
MSQDTLENATIETIARFETYLQRAAISPHTTRAYLRWLQEFCSFLQQSNRLLETILADEHERVFAAFRRYSIPTMAATSPHTICNRSEPISKSA